MATRLRDVAMTLAACIGGAIGISFYAFDVAQRAAVRARNRVAARFAIPPWRSP